MNLLKEVLLAKAAVQVAEKKLSSAKTKLRYAEHCIEVDTGLDALLMGGQLTTTEEGINVFLETEFEEKDAIKQACASRGWATRSNGHSTLTVSM